MYTVELAHGVVFYFIFLMENTRVWQAGVDKNADLDIISKFDLGILKTVTAAAITSYQG
jgi:hypothetical protein